MSSEDVMHWLNEQLAKAEQSVKAREQSHQSWAGGTTESWREVGCRMTKAQRLKESAAQGRIAVKCRRDVEMLKAVIQKLSRL